MSITKSEIIVWSMVTVALAGVVVLALYSGMTTSATMVFPLTPAPSGESGGVAPEKTSELLPAPAGELGDHACVERSGRPMNTSELRGKFVVADFIFTSCSGTCPAMTQKMFELQQALKARTDVLLASFSVDPERDTPEALAAFADRYGAQKNKWLFLRCEKPVIAEIAYDRVKLWKSRDDPAMHSAQFALLDREGRVRGYYSPLIDPKWLGKLLADLDILRGEPAR